MIRLNINDLINEDKSFTEASFLAKVDNTYIMLLSAIITNNLSKVDHKIGDKLYDKYKKYLEDLNNNNLRQMYDELNVKSSKIIDIEKNDINYIIKVELVSRYLDYKIDKTTLKKVSGDNTVRIEKKKILTFEKKIDSKDLSNIRTCPNCGASIDYNHNGMCKYCRSIFNTEDYDWILVDIREI